MYPDIEIRVMATLRPSIKRERNLRNAQLYRPKTKENIFSCLLRVFNIVRYWIQAKLSWMYSVVGKYSVRLDRGPNSFMKQEEWVDTSALVT